MSDTNLTPKNALWKQLVGALAGAAVAFIVYQAYAFTSTHMQALIILPGGAPASSVVRPPRHQIYLVPASSSSVSSPDVFMQSSSASSASSASGQSSSDSLFYGPFGTLKNLKRLFLWQTSSSSSSPEAVMVMESSSSSSVSPTIPFTDNRHTWPKATLSFPTETYQQVSSSASSGTRYSPPPRMTDEFTAPQPMVPTEEMITEDFSDQESMSDPAEEPAPAEEVIIEAQEISSPSWIGTEEAPVQEEAAEDNPPVESMPAVTSSMPASGALPQSGFGLDLIALMALGGAIGGRRKKSGK